ncbi:MAG: DUF1788 domain-containing protein [Desulfobulbaceae bacterium]|uniref:DUF1788 domain-containing protein n=1 Tax=Candidatus Desulfobia pelagia TaxID=2841692 RepID=A0A8J6TEK1_9BACT|nr:DUF1788 domain-containing protein [Candidatus Desulfobia pelagia]
MVSVNYDMNPFSIQESFDHLLKLISSERFLKKQGLGNEVPFFICPYPPQKAADMDKLRIQLRNKLEQQGIRILDINLYDLAVGLLKKRNIWERILETEKSVDKEQLKELLQGVLDSQSHLVPAIAEEMSKSEFDVMFISGVGEVFPYIRSHNVLNNLQSTAKDQPTVMFFPGVYTHSLETGASLDLFGCLHDDKYYRAFNIFHCEI